MIFYKEFIFMRNFLRFGFVAMALFFVFGTVSVNETNAQINQILKQMQSRYKKLKTLRADILSEMYDVQLGESDTMQGSLIFLPLKGRNALLRVDWKKPRMELLSVIDNQYVVFNPSIKQAYIGSAEQIKKALRSREVR